jgi:8-oxo-dGTP pyrophosphatase MutT (NUDIX family)
MIALLLTDERDWIIPLTLRPSNMVDHGGQVSLPGGRCEPNETPWKTSCREFREELGCETSFLQPVGFLSPLYVYASRHIVTPLISVCASTIDFQPNPEEVAELLFLPLSELVSENAVRMGTLRKGSSHFDAPGFHVGEHFVWGATAMILGELRNLVRSVLHR